ncbi:MAG: zinc ribbon domain-containing protein [Lachnospiraceae bacterium]|nr:zinc ribbon domain-containing protein [Lachnospiraceae bacterium]
MSLINCPECKKAISSKATTCPNCGYPIHSATSNQPPQRNTPQTPVKQKKKGMVVLLQY